MEPTPEEAAAALEAAGVKEWVSTSVEEEKGQSVIVVGVTSAREQVASAVRAALAPLPVRLQVEDRPHRH